MLTTPRQGDDAVLASMRAAGVSGAAPAITARAGSAANKAQAHSKVAIDRAGRAFMLAVVQGGSRGLEGEDGEPA